MNARRAHVFINAVLFQLAWLVCVQGKSGWALAMTLLVMLLHWRIIVVDGREWQLWLVALMLGFVVDSLLISAGVLQLSDPASVQPLWLACLWILFASTLLHSTAFLQRSLLLSAGAGFLGGPLAYVAGSRFGAARLGSDFSESLPPLFEKGLVLFVLALCWAVVVPLLVSLARRISGTGAHQLVK